MLRATLLLCERVLEVAGGGLCAWQRCWWQGTKAHDAALPFPHSLTHARRQAQLLFRRPQLPRLDQAAGGVEGNLKAVAGRDLQVGPQPKTLRS